MVLLTVISILAFVMAMMAFVVGVWALVELLAFKKSTHQIQFMPADQAIPQSMPELFKKDIMKDDLDALT